MNSSFSKKSKGFIISLDAAIAVVVLATAMLAMQIVMFQEQPSRLLQEMQKADDVFVALDNSGFLLEQVDLENLDVIAQNIRFQALSLLPNDFNARVELRKFKLNPVECRKQESFENCFTLDEAAVAGGSMPEDTSIVHDRKLFAKKQSPGDCNLSKSFYFKGKEEKIKEFNWRNIAEFVRKNFGKVFEAFFQGEDSNVTIEVSVTKAATGGAINKGDSIECDENVRVDLNASFPTKGRPPINLIFGADKSQSMRECAIAKGIKLASSTGITPSSFQKVLEFSLQDNNAFDVLLEWRENCITNCPKLYVISPVGTKFGFDFPATTDINVSSCNPSDTLNSRAYYLSKSTFDYLALNSNIANPKSGAWEVWVEKQGSALDYNLTVKGIRNEYFNSSLQIAPWNNPISKIELAQVFIAKMNALALWDAEADEYAYAEIGLDKKGSGDNSSIQPASGLRPIGDQAFKSQLKNLSAISTDFSAFGFAMAGNGMMNEMLSKQPSLEVRIEILFGDADSNGTPNAITAANDAKDKNIVVFSVGFGRDYNFADLKIISQITGGKFYNAEDENALEPVFELIAQEILGMTWEKWGIGAPDLNIEIPILPGSIVSSPASTFQGSFELEEDFLKFFVKDLNFLTPWLGHYFITFPCNNDNACNDENKFFPEQGTTYGFSTKDESYYDIPFPIETQIEVLFKYRNYDLNITGGGLLDYNTVALQLKIENNGHLNSLAGQNTIDVNFYLNEPESSESILLQTLEINGVLCASKNPDCQEPFTSVETSTTVLNNEGVFYAKIDENVLRDCPKGNKDFIICRSGLKTEFYSIDYYVWRNER